MTKRPIEVNVRSNIRYFSERPNETGFVTIEGREIDFLTLKHGSIDNVVQVCETFSDPVT